MTTLYEKVSIEEVIDETEFDIEWVKYTASLCKECGVEPGELHLCDKKPETN